MYSCSGGITTLAGAVNKGICLAGVSFPRIIPKLVTYSWLIAIVFSAAIAVATLPKLIKSTHSTADVLTFVCCILYLDRFMASSLRLGYIALYLAVA